MGESDLPLRQPFNSDPKGSLLNGSMVEWMRTCENPTHMARIVPDNPFAFPPSLEVRCGKCREAQATDWDVGS